MLALGHSLLGLPLHFGEGKDLVSDQGKEWSKGNSCGFKTPLPAADSAHGLLSAILLWLARRSWPLACCLDDNKAKAGQ